MSEPARGFLEPLVQQSTPSIIADKLRAAIGHGHLTPGSQLGEADLARELGVSRGPLREGIQRLTQEGLLTSVRNRGVFVIEMTPENIRDLYVARGGVERAAAQEALRRDAEAAAARLMDRARAIGDAGADPEAVGEADIAFHEALVELAGSPRLSRVHRTLMTETRMSLRLLDGDQAASGDRVSSHHEIAEAFGAGEAPTVDRLLHRHMEDAVSRLLEDLGHA